MSPCLLYIFLFFFFNDTATTEIYTLSLHDALPIRLTSGTMTGAGFASFAGDAGGSASPDRKSTRLNSSHGYISYAVFCLKKKKNIRKDLQATLLQGHHNLPHRRDAPAAARHYTTET